MATVVSLPLVHYGSCRFRPVQPRRSERMRSGRRTETVVYNDHYWIGSWTTIWLDREKMALLDHFATQCQTRAVLFLGYDVLRPRPLKMDTGRPLSGVRAGGGAFDGTATVTSLLFDRVGVSGLPAGFQLSVGDYVELRKSELVRSLHMVDVAVNASAGGAATVRLVPNVNTEAMDGATIVNFEKASALMEMDPGSYDPERSWSNRMPSFSGTEMFPREEVA